MHDSAVRVVVGRRSESQSDSHCLGRLDSKGCTRPGRSAKLAVLRDSGSAWALSDRNVQAADRGAPPGGGAGRVGSGPHAMYTSSQVPEAGLPTHA
jgi:hypothetical protein